MSDVIQSDREAARVRAITAIRALVVDLETWSPEMIEDLRNTPQAALMREWLSRPSRLASSADLSSKLDVAIEALRAVKYESERENGGWVHLKRVIAVKTAKALATIGRD